MFGKGNQTKPVQIETWVEEQALLADSIRKHAEGGRHLDILEAGCGTRWDLGLKDVDYTLTGLDNDADALEIRQKKHQDIDIAILGDLTNVSLEENAYDVIFSSYVLEHVEGAEQVLDRFRRWLKPNGIIVLRIPNRDSAKGFLTRVTPFWFNVLYKKYYEGVKDAGKPGHDPFPTPFDEVVSSSGIQAYCHRHGLKIMGEYNGGREYQKHRMRWIFSWMLFWPISILSGGSITAKYAVMIYIIENTPRD